MIFVLADVVLLLHVGYAVFVIGGLLVVLLGAWLDWRWVRARSAARPARQPEDRLHPCRPQDRR